ncbi:MAG TPA: hypothetical protein VL625_04390 [Patescibacteria group bacterium]|nr:hypothetical protein [Patescibacteria group bacterium]
MPTYRGVDREQIKQSVTNAVARLRELDIGEATREMLDVWESGNPLQQLDMAEDDERLLAVLMNISGTRDLFMNLVSVLRYNAAVAARGEPDAAEKDKKIFQDLIAWGAFVPGAPGQKEEWLAVADEARQYVLKKCLDRLDPDDCEPGRPAYEAFQAAVESLKKENPLIEKHLPKTDIWFRDSVPLYINLHSFGEDRKIAELLDQYPEAAGFLVNALYKMTGLPEDEAKLPLSHPIRFYKAVVPFPATDAASGSAAFNGAADEKRATERAVFVREAAETILRELAPFFPVDQATGKTIIADDAEKNECVVMFLGTRAAAQSVADSLRNYRIYDHTGAQLMPAPKGPLPPSFQPQS